MNSKQRKVLATTVFILVGGYGLAVLLEERDIFYTAVMLAAVVSGAFFWPRGKE